MAFGKKRDEAAEEETATHKAAPSCAGCKRLLALIAEALNELRPYRPNEAANIERRANET